MKTASVLLILSFCFALTGLVLLKNHAATIKNIFPDNPTLKVNTIVSYVIDGDTIDVGINNQRQRVRLLGVNTPETVDKNKPVECFGKEASAFLKRYLTGKSIVLESDPSQDDKDIYGRLLRYVFLSDGTNVDLLLIRSGYGREYTFKNQHFIFEKEFIEAENHARSEKKGLWGKCGVS